MEKSPACGLPEAKFHDGKKRMKLVQKDYRKTLLACYLGIITQAIAANFAPLLFLKFHTDWASLWAKSP